MCNGIKIVWLGCEKHSQNYPKNGQKTVLFQFFLDFLKNCPYDSNEICYSRSTPYYGPLCAVPKNSYGWDVRNSQNEPKNGQKTAVFRLFLIFAKTVHTI